MARSLSKIRSRALHSQGGRCFYCSVLMWSDDCAAFARRHGLTPRIARWLQCTAEHLQARQAGGGNSIKNIAAVCRVCNTRRHAQRKIALTPEEYRALVRKRVSRKAWHPPQVFERGLIGSG
ncbi:MAG: HNH endonuclease [Steroidobacteraceae bacterium]|nr:HNH endonuclease [Steroidobacteraceae bacterium]MBP7014555.1 HNH endonuclease [Steroidobacteraceae bacterium]